MKRKSKIFSDSQIKVSLSNNLVTALSKYVKVLINF